MTSIADAYVELHVDGDNIEGEVRADLKNAERGTQREFDRAGSSLGESMAGGFLKGWNVKNRRITRDGKVVGAAFAATFASSLRSGMTAASGVMEGFAKSVKGINLRQLKTVGIGGLIAVVPLLTSSIGALTGSLTAFIGAAAQASYASFALLGTIGSLIQAKMTMKIVTGGLTDALKGVDGAMEKLAPSAQNVVKALKGLTPEWEGLKKSVQGAALEGVGPMLTTLGKTTLPTLKAGLTGTGTVLNGVIKDLLRFAQTKSFVDRLGVALKGNNTIIKNLGSAVRPVLNGILNVYVALLPAAQKLSRAIAGNAQQFSKWSGSKKNMDGLMDAFERGWKAAGRLWKITKNLGATLKNVFGAAVGPGNGLLKTFVQLTGRLRDFTALASTKNAIAEFARKGIKASGMLFTGLGKVGTALAPLFDPAILLKFVSLFKTVQPTLASAFGGIVSIVQSVFGAVLAFVTPVFEKIGEAINEHGSKFEGFFSAIGGLVKALSPLLSGIGSVIGEVIGQTIGFLGTVAMVLGKVITFITPAIAAISNFVGPLLSKFAPIIAAVILAFVNWGSVVGKVIMGFIRFIPVIGRFLAPLVKLASWLISKIAPAFKLLGRIVGFVFRGMTKVVGVAVRFIGRIVGGTFRFIGRVVSTVARGIWTAVSSAFNAVRNVVGSVVGAVFNFVKGGFTRVLNFIKGLPGQILNLAGSFLNAGTELGNKIIGGIMDGLRAAGGFVSDLMGSIKSAINSALNLPFTIKGPGPLPDFTIPAFAKGGVAPGGMALVGERGPEIVNLPRGTRVHTASESRRMQQSGQDGRPRKVILRVGAREFVGFMEEIADDRIDAAESLAMQGS